MPLPRPYSATPDPGILLVLSEIFRDVLDDPSLEIAAGSTPDEIPGWDSFQHIALLVEAECRFGVLFEPEEVAALTSVGVLACAIAGKRHVPSVSNAPV